MNNALSRLYDRPKSPENRLLRSSVLGTFLLITFLLLTHLAIATPGTRLTARWPVASLITTISLLTAACTFPLRKVVKKATHFYILEQLLQLPAGLGLVTLGLNILGLLEPGIFVFPLIIGTGLATALVVIGTERRRAQIRRSIKTDSPLKFSAPISTWDTTKDTLQDITLARFQDAGPIESILFWIGPAAGIIAARLLGSEITSLLGGFVLLGLGFQLTILKIEVATSYYLELKDVATQAKTELLILDHR